MGLRNGDFLLFMLGTQQKILEQFMGSKCDIRSENMKRYSSEKVPDASKLIHVYV